MKLLMSAEPDEEPRARKWRGLRSERGLCRALKCKERLSIAAAVVYLADGPPVTVIIAFLVVLRRAKDNFTIELSFAG